MRALRGDGHGGGLPLLGGAAQLDGATRAQRGRLRAGRGGRLHACHCAVCSGAGAQREIVRAARQAQGSHSKYSRSTYILRVLAVLACACRACRACRACVRLRVLAVVLAVVQADSALSHIRLQPSALSHTVAGRLGAQPHAQEQVRLVAVPPHAGARAARPGQRGRGHMRSPCQRRGRPRHLRGEWRGAEQCQRRRSLQQQQQERQQQQQQ